MLFPFQNNTLLNNELNGPFYTVFRREIRHACEEEGGLVGARQFLGGICLPPSISGHADPPRSEGQAAKPTVTPQNWHICRLWRDPNLKLRRPDNNIIPLTHSGYVPTLEKFGALRNFEVLVLVDCTYLILKLCSNVYGLLPDLKLWLFSSWVT